MEVYGALGGIGVLAAFGCAFTLTFAVCARPSVSAPGLFVSSDSGRSGRIARRMRNGFRWTRPIARWLLEKKGIADLVKEATWVADSHGYATSMESLLSVFMVFVGVLALVLSLVTTSAVCGVAVVACVCAVAVARLKTARDKRREALREAVPDALRSMGVCFQSGLSLMQTFQQVAKETQGPLRDLFERSVHRMEAGRGTRDALDTLRSGASVSELAFVAVALDVQHQAGGSMRQVLDAARDSVESELDLRRSLRVQTAQAKLSARVVSVMPFALIAVFSLVSEGFLEPFFASPAGFALLGLALGMQVAGILAVRRMLAVEVD